MKNIFAKAFIKVNEHKVYGLRINLTLILENQDAKGAKSFGKNYMNMELTPSKSLDLADYQLILFEKNLQGMIQNSKGFMFENVPIVAGIGKYESGDKYYFVKAQISESVSRTFYLTRSQVMMLKYVNLGFEFTEMNEDPEDTDGDNSKKKEKVPTVEA